jgi:protein-S-isoprenylcysteine O-methyltransferase Ste14
MNSETIFRITFWILLTGLWLMRVYFSRSTNRTADRSTLDRNAIAREGRGLFIGRTVVVLFLAGLLVLYALDSPWLKALSIPLPAWLRWAGFGLGLASLSLWTWAEAALGKQYSPLLHLHDQHKLVTWGPYARIRHPMYAAMSGMGTAFALVTANWPFALFAATLITGFVVRAPREERMLETAFGDAYREYQDKTGRFFPKF